MLFESCMYFLYIYCLLDHSSIVPQFNLTGIYDLFEEYILACTFNEYFRLVRCVKVRIKEVGFKKHTKSTLLVLTVQLECKYN